MSTPTGEVFRTDAPAGSNTFWRLFNAGTQYGRLFNTNSTNHFIIDALAGQLRMQSGCSTPIS